MSKLANEQRLIDANALSEAVNGIGKDIKRPRAVELACLVLIADAPTVDAVEVKHGRWEHTHGGGRFKVTCTACDVAVMKGSTELFGIPTVGWAYCPRCGAKMDGGINR